MKKKPAAHPVDCPDCDPVAEHGVNPERVDEGDKR